MNTHDRFTDDLRQRTVLRLAFGGLAALCFLAFIPRGVPMGWALDLGWITAAVGAGMLVRGLELRAFFGNELSLHQSQSLQAVLDFSRWASPLQSRRRLETELVARETDLSAERVGAWSAARQRWRIALLPALAAVALGLLTSHAIAAALAAVASLVGSIIACWPILRAAASGQAGARNELRRELAMLAVAVAALTAEALLLRPVLLRLGALDAAWVFCAFALVRAVPVTPFGIGALQLATAPLVLLAASTEAGFLALVLHAAWVAASLVPAAVYLPRYKLRAADFFNRGLPARLARSRRPAQGWQPERECLDARPGLSVVIPAYNELERLPGYLPDVAAFVEANSPDGEVIVVDDGSSDGTAAYVNDFSTAHPCVRLVQRPRNGGKGRAVLDGVDAARSRYILVADADGATPIVEASLLLAAAARGAEIVIGSRVVGTAPRGRDALRAALGRVFYSTVNFLAVPGIADTQCGFKLFRLDAARALFRELGEHGWAFDVEILYRAQLAGYGVAEVPVRWQEIAGSKVRPFRDGYRMFMSLLRIRSRNSGFFGVRAAALLVNRPDAVGQP
jgi:dolichyl-phosphate beta-glucosyltransferase